MISARQLGDGVHRNPSVPRSLFVASQIESRRTIAFHQELDHVVFPCCADVDCILLRQDNILFSLDLAAMSALVTLAHGHGFGALALSEVVSYTSATNHRSRAVMERLGMSRDPAEDFDYPALPESHPLRRHVLYRLSSRSF